MEDERICPLLKDPPKEYRAKPFWAWNGTLDKEELLRQVGCMHEMGFGGFFIHSRTGLKTEYLGKEWFDCVRACAVRAKELGMETWLYDEDRWPSGVCGGLVTRERKNRLRFISLYRSEEEALSVKEVAGILARYAVKTREEDGEEVLVDYYKVNGPSEVKEGYFLAVFAEEEQACSDFYNGYAYIDAMNRDVTELFLKSTHEKYFEACGDLFGSAIKGIFTDEPHRGPAFTGFSISNRNSAAMTPYTAALPQYYLKKYGKELQFPEIYWRRKGESYSSVSEAYIDCLDDLFLENFAKPCRDWCAAHNIKITGHILHEDLLSIQTSLSGSCMRYYEHMDYPGIDVLTENNRIYWAAKQCSSVARQLGKKFVLSELYGATGWDMTLDRYKRCADWQAFYGINFRCPHLSWYTMQGEAKRDYPASILHQNAWMREWKNVEDYFARLSVLSAEGERLCDTLVVVPYREMWGYVHKGWMSGMSAQNPAAAALDRKFLEEFDELTKKNIDFDYGDEELIGKYAQVTAENGKPCLKIGNARYTTVLWSGRRLSKEAQEILNRFRNAGGTFVRTVGETQSGYAFSSPENTVCSAYRSGKDYWLFALNLSEDCAEGKVYLPEFLNGFEAELWDFRSGECRGKMPILQEGSRRFLNVEFAPAGELIVRFSKRASKKTMKPHGYPKPVFPEEFTYRLKEPNVLPLDEAIFSVNGSVQNEGKKRNVLLIDRDIRKRYNFRIRGGEMLQPWFRAKYCKGDRPQKMCDLSVRFSFFTDRLPRGEVYLCLEKTNLKCTLNGVPIGGKCNRFWVDKCFSLYPVTLREGENVVELSGEFSEDDGLEAVYLIGDFGVKLPNIVTELPQKLKRGDIAPQGLPYYSGAIEYETGIVGGKYTVSFENPGCSVMLLHGGKEVKTLAFAPYTSEIELDGELKLELIFNRRNTFGPLHQAYPQSVCEPSSFLTDGDEYVDFVPVPQGLFVK